MILVNNESLVLLVFSKVTFKDPEAAKKACQNPSPIIDGRRANCNLASIGANKNRPQAPQHGLNPSILLPLPFALSFILVFFDISLLKCHLSFCFLLLSLSILIYLSHSKKQAICHLKHCLSVKYYTLVYCM